MTVELTKSIEPGGFKCSVISSSPGLPGQGPCIVFPVASINAWTDTEIAEIARALVEHAEHARAVSFAEWIVCNLDKKGRVPEQILREHADGIAFIRRWQGRDSDIEKALYHIEMTESWGKMRQQIPTIRQAVKKDYTKLLVRIGRRDGFFCQACGIATKDMTIDHIKPVSKGGTNDLGNLQLLCAACNLLKRDN